MWNVETNVIPVIIGATGTISKSLRKHVSNTPGKREVKDQQKTAILGTAHILRKVKGKGNGKVIPLQARCGQTVGRGIALLSHDRGTKMGWVVSSTPRPHFTPGRDPVHILQEAGYFGKY